MIHVTRCLPTLKSLVLTILFVILCAACSQKSGGEEPLAKQVQSEGVSSVEPGSAEPPSPTSTPTSLPTPTPTPWVEPGEPITTSNVTDIETLARMGMSEILEVAWVPDGTSFAVATGSGTHFFDAENLEAIAYIDSGYTSQIAFNPDGSLLASGYDSSIQLWDPATSELVRTISQTRERIDDLAFSRDGETLIAACTSHASSSVSSPLLTYIDSYRTDTGARTNTITIRDPDGDILTPRLTKDGSFVVTRSMTTLSWWNGRSGTLLYSNTNVGSYGTELFALTAAGGVEVRDVESQESLHVLQADGVRAFSFNGRGDVLVTVGNETLILWDPYSGEKLEEHPWESAPEGAIFLSPDNSHVVDVTPERITLYDVGSGEVLGVVSGFYDRMMAYAVHPDGMQVAFSTGHHKFDGVQLGTWDLINGERTIFYGDGVGESINAVEAMRYLPDGTLVTNQDDDTVLILWDVESGTPIERIDVRTKAYHFAFSPDQSILAIGAYQCARLWDVERDEILSQIGHFPSAINSLAVSEDGKVLGFSSAGTFSFGTYESFAVLWDVVNDQEIQVDQYSGEQHRIQAVAFQPDGAIFAYASGEKIHLRDAGTGATLGTLAGHESPISDMAFSPDGTLLASLGEDEGIRFWDVENAECLFDVPMYASGLTFTNDGRLLILHTRGSLAVLGLSGR
jgi:WD40 repeat protein